MVTKIETWGDTKTRTSEKVRSLSKGIGLLRSIVIGGAIFSLLSVPLLLNVQTTRYNSEISSLTFKMQKMQSKIIDKKAQIDLILETNFPNTTVVKIDGRIFFIRKGK